MDLNIKITGQAIKNAARFKALTDRHKKVESTKVPLRDRLHVPVRHAGHVKVRTEELDAMFSLIEQMKDSYSAEVERKMNERYGQL